MIAVVGGYKDLAIATAHQLVKTRPDVCPYR